MNMKNITMLCVLAAAGLAVGCGDTSKEETATLEEGATPRTAQHELDGTRDPSDLDPITAQRWIDNVRMGHGVDPAGKIPEDMNGDNFGTNDPVYISMEVTDAPAGSKVRVAIFDKATDREVWTAEQSVAPGKTYLTFNIDRGKLPTGEYRAEVIVGDETVANRTFAVTEHRA